MSASDNVAVIREVFRAIETRDPERLLELLHPDIEFRWAPSLPYGANLQQNPAEGATWAGTWIPLQPTATEQGMDLRVVAASADEVVALWRQKGVTAAGERFEGEVLALYLLRAGKLARAQMFDFDSAAVAGFLARAAG